MVDGVHCWWIDNHHHRSSSLSPWLQSTLSELECKTKAMLKLIEGDADSFAQRAEMYYKKRPQLISMLEDFYRAHCSLAERYDQLKAVSGIRLVATLEPSVSSKIQPCMTDQASDTHSEGSGREYCPESEVDDPEQESTKQVEDENVDIEIEGTDQDGVNQMAEETSKPNDFTNVKMRETEAVIDEIAKLRGEIERMEIENKFQKDQLREKDDEKREVIRQLSVAIELLQVENMHQSRHAALSRVATKKESPFESGMFKSFFSTKRFNRSAKPRQSILAI